MLVMFFLEYILNHNKMQQLKLIPAIIDPELKGKPIEFTKKISRSTKKL